MPLVISISVPKSRPWVTGTISTVSPRTTATCNPSDRKIIDVTGTSKGIYAYSFDTITGELSRTGLAAATDNPTFLVTAPDHRTIYAANELDTALIVNPHDIDGMARAIATALSMPLTERRMRYEAMMERLNGHTIQQWFAEFVDALQECGADGAAPTAEPLISESPGLWPKRTIHSAAARYH